MKKDFNSNYEKHNKYIFFRTCKVRKCKKVHDQMWGGAPGAVPFLWHLASHWWRSGASHLTIFFRLSTRRIWPFWWGYGPSVASRHPPVDMIGRPSPACLHGDYPNPALSSGGRSVHYAFEPFPERDWTSVVSFFSTRTSPTPKAPDHTWPTRLRMNSVLCMAHRCYCLASTLLHPH